MSTHNHHDHSAKMAPTVVHMTMAFDILAPLLCPCDLLHKLTCTLLSAHPSQSRRNRCPCSIKCSCSQHRHHYTPLRVGLLHFLGTNHHERTLHHCLSSTGRCIRCSLPRLKRRTWQGNLPRTAPSKCQLDCSHRRASWGNLLRRRTSARAPSNSPGGPEHQEHPPKIQTLCRRQKALSQQLVRNRSSCTVQSLARGASASQGEPVSSEF
mmetsp:Transcript_38002/g.101258  ORF Transcript_38002/g.101258 Transcript_38002/m.101258 type:complete len:210 (+) Transcript_38002:1298-1927(+)